MEEGYRALWGGKDGLLSRIKRRGNVWTDPKKSGWSNKAGVPDVLFTRNTAVTRSKGKKLRRTSFLKKTSNFQEKEQVYKRENSVSV